MSPAVQELFMNEIAPLLIATVPRVVVAVGAEDADELVQDALVSACRAVHQLEQSQRPIVPRSVAYYTIQRLKTGRRSTGAGRTDVMSPGCQLDGHSRVMSLDQPVNSGDGDEDERLTLGELLSSRRDDPSQAAARHADWGEFMTMLDAPQRYIVQATARGERVTDQATRLGVSPPAVCQRRDTIARRALAFWGDAVLQDVSRMPLWRRQQAQQR